MKSYIVDSFTDEPFKGNPAGVCFVDRELTDDQMLKIAQEFNLSETAFVAEANTPGNYTIRYFSPKKEIPLCGHATLASSKIIFSNSDLNEINFINIQGLNLAIKKAGNNILMSFPVYDTVEKTAPLVMLEALGLSAVLNTRYNSESRIILLEIDSAAVLAGLSPDYGALIKSYTGINGVLVTVPSNNEAYDFHYRYFWPWAGTNEDPVTGGVQTFLTKYWSNKIG